MTDKTERKRGEPFPGEPAALVSVLVAAVRTKDHELARAARRELAERHGMRVSFVRAKEVANG